MAAREEVSEWQKLPAPLQHQFYDHAVREAERRIESLRRLEGKLRTLKEDLKFNEVDGSDWKRLRVGVVDGSCPPAPDTRLGGSYALFCSSYKIFEGDRLVDEGYRSGMLFIVNTASGVSSRAILKLLMTRLERKSALEAFEKGVDWLIVDGSFFGFRYRCLRVKDVEATWYEGAERGDVEEYTATGREIIEEIFKDTEKILKKNSAAVVKRPRTAAIDGYLIEKRWKEISESVERGVKKKLRPRNVVEDILKSITTSLIDKAVLSIIMCKNTYFMYDSLFKHPGDFYFYSMMARMCQKWIERRMSEDKPLDYNALFADSVKMVEKHRERAENIPKSIFNKYYSILIDEVRRGYFKAYDEAPACCFEIRRNSSLDEILPYLVGFSNPDTGHPFPLDLVDEDVRLPIKFVREFVQEVEAQALKRADVDLVRDLFQYLNPQKKWGY